MAFELYHNSTICIQAGWLLNEAEVLSIPNYKYHVQKGNLEVVRRGCRNNPALIRYDSMPQWIKDKVVELAGDPKKLLQTSRLEGLIKPDPEAAKYFSQYRLDDGRALPADVQIQYTVEAQILNAVRDMVSSLNAKRRSTGAKLKGLWQVISDQVNELDKSRYPHDLPSNPRRLQGSKSYKDRQKVGRCYWRYINEGYYGLIHNGFCNDNSRKVDERLETLILQLYTRANKPYTSDVHQDYNLFMAGALELVDRKTGLILDPLDYLDANGKKIEIDAQTCYRYINQPKNRAIVDKYRSGSLEHNSKHRPHHHRSAPNYSLSKISLDDRDLPRKMHDGKRVKAYYAYDVASGCVIGAAYSKKKDTNLFLDCVRDMFQTLHRNGLGIPMEVEVEHHLVNQFRDDLMKAGNVFPIVRWCNPGNSQEKRAEHFNRRKKYGFEKKHQEGIGRFYAKNEANRTISEKVFDEDNDNYQEKTYEFEQLVADDLWIIEQYNQSQHPDQKRYPGMTCWEVLMENLNPNLAQLDESILLRFIGDHTETSLRRNHYCRVQYQDFGIPSPEVIRMLEPNNTSLDAYYLPEKDGSINKVYLYQKGVFICEAERIAAYNEASAEQTDEDRKAYQNQASYVAKFDSMIKEGKERLGRVQSESVRVEVDTVEAEEVEYNPYQEEDSAFDLQELDDDDGSEAYKSL